MVASYLHYRCERGIDHLILTLSKKAHLKTLNGFLFGDTTVFAFTVQIVKAADNLFLLLYSGLRLQSRLSALDCRASAEHPAAGLGTCGLF